MKTSCIPHPANQWMAIVRADYYQLTQDCVMAALLNFFEYRANGAIDCGNTSGDSVSLGQIKTSEFQDALLGISTDKQIRARLKLLENSGFISSEGKRNSAKEWTFHIKVVINSLGHLTTQNTDPVGQTTNQLRSNNQPTAVKQPTNCGQTTNQLRSFDQPSYI